jgi:hypothetical protein
MDGRQMFNHPGSCGIVTPWLPLSLDFGCACERGVHIWQNVRVARENSHRHRRRQWRRRGKDDEQGDRVDHARNGCSRDSTSPGMATGKVGDSGVRMGSGRNAGTGGAGA